MNKQNSQTALFAAIHRICKPLVRILLRNGIPFSGFVDILKSAYVEVAKDEFGVKGKPSSQSRIATLTGLTRKDVKRLSEENDSYLYSGNEHYNRAARVIFGWVHDPRYQDLDEKPNVLEIQGNSQTFSSLVKEYSGDIPYRAVLDELQINGIVKIEDGNWVRLVKPAYIPGENEIEQIGILGRDVGGLLQTIDRNVYQKENKAFFQRKVYYDNLSEEALLEIQQMLESRGQEFLQAVDRYMAKRDRDVNTTIKGTGRKAAGIGLYYFEEDVKEKSDE